MKQIIAYTKQLRNDMLKIFPYTLLSDELEKRWMIPLPIRKKEIDKNKFDQLPDQILKASDKNIIKK